MSELPAPNHIAIIMDGNGRWAEDRGLPRLEGHRRGSDAVRAVVRHCRRIGVRALTLYAFSEQNWGRPPHEVVGLMQLLREFILGEWNEILDNGIRLVSIGQTRKLPGYVRTPLQSLQRASAHNSDMTLCLALSYGGREEIVHAARSLAEEVAAGKLKPSQINAKRFEQALYSAVLPSEPDLVLRTSGEMRLSNFLLWQSAYAELYFTETLWPDFEPAELDRAITAYRRRERRYGLVPAPAGAAAACFVPPGTEVLTAPLKRAQAC